MLTIAILAFLAGSEIALSHGFSIQPKIANGEVINTTVPYFVSLHSQQKCSGSLISDSWILTAAHCLEARRSVEVDLGIQPNGTFEHTELIIDVLFIYDGYFLSYRRHDIALLKLSRPIRFSQNIQPVKLPNNCDELGIGEAMRSIGSGLTNLNHTAMQLDGLVRHVTLETIDPKLNPLIVEHGYVNPPSPSLIFTDSPDEVYRGPLPGDSGGPLIRLKDGLQYGIAKSIGLNESNTYQAYTKISYFFDWISHVTGLKLPKCQPQAPVDGWQVERMVE